MRFLSTAGAVLLPVASLVSAIEFNPDDEASIRSVSQKYAYGLMSYYKNNATNLPKEEIGIFAKPIYWWEAGAVWGGLIEYAQIFQDASYTKTVQQALVANYGPKNDVILPWKKDQEGNDDQAFWCLATMAAMEYGFPEPSGAPATYQEVTENCFENMMSRWDTNSCGGGLKWQIYPENAYGYNYKNSISNGAAFALAARLYRFTGDQKYSDWASKIYKWTKDVGLIGEKFEVFDGTDEKTGCKTISDKTEWTYNNAMFLHGCAFMYDATKDNSWKDLTNKFLERAGTFFSNPGNKENVMFEVCENGGKGCNLDQQSFKAYLARWMAKTAILVPSTKDTIATYLKTSAKAAAGACSGGDDGISCGSRWYTGNFDGLTGIGQQLAALEVTQNLLMIKKNTIPSKGGESQPKPSSSSAAASSSAQPSSVAPSSTAPSSPAAPSTVSSDTPAQSSTDSPSAVPKESTVASAAPSTSSSQGAAQTPAQSAAKSSAQAPAESSAQAPAESSAQIPAGSSAQTPAETPAGSGAAPSSVAPESTSTASSTAGQFGEVHPSSTADSCGCASKSVVTVWVPPTPPTSAPAPPPTFTPVQPPPAPNTTVPVPSAPPANSSSPVLFPGAASNVKMAGSTLFAAAALAVLASLL